ncbi:MAG: RsmD family RNA methyltransferase [Flavobacteriales bacterium]|nr:RsmD family RNA methyltransferase [Flavobacteriales bacterium]
MNEATFIQQNRDKKLSEVALLLSKHPELDKDFIINQINGLQKARTKLPEFYRNPEIIYPATISMEQCSSEATAVFKSELFEPGSLIDLTGGFGIDSYYFSKKMNRVTYLEPNNALFTIVQQNFTRLNTPNTTLINDNCENFIENNKQLFDVAYIDPSRRNEQQKVFLLSDCIPHIVDLQSAIFKIAAKILVKTSPMMDIKQSLKELGSVTKVWVVSLNNECKEVLYLLEEKGSNQPEINTVNIIHPSREARVELQEYLFDFNAEENSPVEFSNPLNYLYEPNASILKAGAFKSLCHPFGLKKLAPHTHLYTSYGLADQFPGRAFQVIDLFPYSAKALKKPGITQANVSCRNFVANVNDVKKKLKIRDGGEHYLFACRDQQDNPIVILCVKV